MFPLEISVIVWRFEISVSDRTNFSWKPDYVTFSYEPDMEEGRVWSYYNQLQLTWLLCRVCLCFGHPIKEWE